MARMIPDMDLELIENVAEKMAYKALSRQLPASWVVRYHYPFCWYDGRRLRDGEADFIVLAPSRGIMIVEVKGSHAVYVSQPQAVASIIEEAAKGVSATAV